MKKTMKTSTFKNTSAAWLAASFLLAGCAQSQPAVVSSAIPGQNAAITSVETQRLTPEEISQVMTDSETSSYILGPNDVISVNVYMHPELSVPNPTQWGNRGGALISSDGTVELPLIGDVDLGGLALKQAQTKLQADYAAYVVQPHVAVELQQPESLRYYLLGAFSAPGVKYPGHPLHLLDALALGGTVNISDSDLYQAYVAQDKVKLPVDLHALLVDGDLSQNIVLAPGDAIVIPTSANESAYVFGAVGKPGTVAFRSGSLTLLQALSVAGMDLTSMTNGKLSQVRIIRSNGSSAQLYVVNAAMILRGQAAPFPLQPGDIVYVPASPVATWNEAISLMLPTLQAAADILTPFVDIKYLRQ